MTHKEKVENTVEELLQSFYCVLPYDIENLDAMVKECAENVVNEIMDELNENNDSTYSMKRILFWVDVKKQIWKF